MSGLVCWSHPSLREIFLVAVLSPLQPPYAARKAWTGSNRIWPIVYILQMRRWTHLASPYFTLLWSLLSENLNVFYYAYLLSITRALELVKYLYPHSEDGRVRPRAGKWLAQGQTANCGENTGVPTPSSPLVCLLLTDTPRCWNI